MPTIYGIITGSEAVSETIQQCLSAGFDRTDIDIIRSFNSDLWMRSPCGHGLPTDRSDHYGQRINRGDTLICVAFRGHAEQARLQDLMEEGGVEDIDCITGSGNAPRALDHRDPVSLFCPIFSV